MRISVLAMSSFALLLAGCNSGSGSARIDRQAVVGTWVEAPSARANPRSAGPAELRPEGFVRRLLIQADGTFVMTLERDGKPVADGKSARGTWAFGTELFEFKVTDNTLPEDSKSLAPAASGGVRKREGEPETLTIEDAGGGVGTFQRA